ncbi:prokineticin receptor 2-like [Acanthaster planci]|uniref:Prokineticin receptor 2-like n=1 Tax=Acanthaster planci TaxID=133434 RepID=A0A8B7ZN98_ACAPL|nr:prokineticin receptor 2-like [Acanthaster planci]XP_022104851.1 prokineticin receptor 2-like [Acanthaster planci]XP_022104852.1 prokineticin receptor 2-like [Acanthaster planci]
MVFEPPEVLDQAAVMGNSTWSQFGNQSTTADGDGNSIPSKEIDPYYYINDGNTPAISFPHVHIAAKIVLCSSYALMMSVCGIGNLLLCYVIYRFRRMRTTTNLLIGNLALSDFLVAVICAPLSFYQHLYQHWPFGTAMCVITNYLKFTSLYVSTNSLLAIAIDRYVIIMHPLKPRMTKCTAGVVLVCIWLVSMIVVIPTAVFTDSKTITNEWGKISSRCGDYWTNPTLLKAHTLFLAIVEFLMPLTIMSIAYVIIAKKLWFREVPGGHVTVQQELAAESSKRKTLRMLIIVVALFAICWAPFYAFSIIRDFVYDSATRETFGAFENAYYIVEALAMSNSMFNTLIYIVFNANFRKYVRQIPESCRMMRRSPRRNNTKSGRRYWYPLMSNSHGLRSSIRSSFARSHSTNISRLGVRREPSAPSTITPSGRSG